MIKGEIWIIDLPDGKGHEQKGERPAVVLGKANGLATVVPLTKNLDHLKFSFAQLVEQTPESGLSCDSIALVFQIVALDEIRFKRKIGNIAKKEQEAIDELIMLLFKVNKQSK